MLPYQRFSVTGTPRACATLATCSAALAGLMSGSSPEPDVVSMSAPAA